MASESHRPRSGISVKTIWLYVHPSTRSDIKWHRCESVESCDFWNYPKIVDSRNANVQEYLAKSNASRWREILLTFMYLIKDNIDRFSHSRLPTSRQSNSRPLSQDCTSSPNLAPLHISLDCNQSNLFHKHNSGAENWPPFAQTSCQ
jgi:hypothetical protein